jgi:hypothetical protein
MLMAGISHSVIVAEINDFVFVARVCNTVKVAHICYSVGVLDGLDNVGVKTNSIFLVGAKGASGIQRADRTPAPTEPAHHVRKVESGGTVSIAI